IYSLVAKPEIKSYADLRGRMLGLADEAGTIALSIRRLLRANGLGDGDYAVRVISGTPTRVGCLKRGDCAAVPLGQPQDIVAQREGYRILGRSDEVTPAYVYTVTAARRSWAAAHADVVVRYIRALATAFAFIRDESNRAAVIAVVMQDTRCSEADAAATLDLYFKPDRNVLPRRGEIDGDAMTRTIALMADGGQLTAPPPPADRFIDGQYLRSAGID
ncbi:MAG TPA: ABC transporter substrate-binding protein, partial [Mycobacterium sp.]|nr:ABC transporter substrate-binding protein [Mycobacterium sp.]